MNMRWLSVLAFGAVAGVSHAIIPNYGPDTVFTGVGQLGGASCVAVAGNWVMTARHVGGTTVTINGVTATAVQRFDHGDADISLLKFSSNVFSNFYSIDFGNQLEQGITMVGYGSTGTPNGSGTGITITGGAGTRRKANNVVDLAEEVTFDNIDFFDAWIVDHDGPTGNGSFGLGAVANEGSLWGGDSGGGWFNSANKLVGINSFIADNPFASNGSNSDYGDLAGAVRLQSYQGWIQSTMAVPEPGSMLALGLPLVALLRRRRAR